MKKNVLDLIAESGKMPILFIGAGISKRYLYHYPDWDTLLKDSFRIIDSDTFLYQKYYDQLKRRTSSPFEINAGLGSYAEEEYNNAFFDKKVTLKVGNSKSPDWLKRGISPYRMYLSQRFKKMRVNRNPELQAELEKFRLLKNKVSAVITTNYDCFLEKEVFNSDFSVFINQSDLFSANSYNIAEIYKIHGCCTDANSLVITKDDYDKFNSSRKLIIAKMLTLFAESPLIFMGYSFTDENVQNIISDFIGCLTPAQVKQIDRHFVFISYEKGQSDLVENKVQIVTPARKVIPVTQIQTDNFALVYDTLNKIVPGLSPLRVRQARHVVKKIVDQSILSDPAAESVIVGLENLNDLDYSNKPLAIAVGYKESILNKYGYGLLSDQFIFEDILYDNKHFDSIEMCNSRLKSFPINRLLPIFKYISQAKACGSDLASDSKLFKYAEAHDTYEKICPSNIAKNLYSLPIVSSMDALHIEMAKNEKLNTKAGVLLKNIQSFSSNDIRDTLSELYRSNSDECMKSTNFKRCVMFLDLIENGHNV